MTATTIHHRADAFLCHFGAMGVRVLFTCTHLPVPPPVELFAVLDNRTKQIIRTVKNFLIFFNSIA